MRRHRVSRRQVQHVIDHAGLIFVQSAPPGSPLQDPRLVYLGDDQTGAPIEVMAVEVQTSQGEDALMVIQAMPMRGKDRPQFEEAKRWRRRNPPKWRRPRLPGPSSRTPSSTTWPTKPKPATTCAKPSAARSAAPRSERARRRGCSSGFPPTSRPPPNSGPARKADPSATSPEKPSGPTCNKRREAESRRLNHPAAPRRRSSPTGPTRARLIRPHMVRPSPPWPRSPQPAGAATTGPPASCSPRRLMPGRRGCRSRPPPKRPARRADPGPTRPTRWRRSLESAVKEKGPGGYGQVGSRLAGWSPIR